MISRLRTSRPWGKFFRNRQATVALGVILLYAIFGLWVLGCDAVALLGRQTGWYDSTTSPILGAFTLDKAESVVGPAEVRGWLQHPQRPEKRLRDCRFCLDEFRKALRQEDPARALAALRLGEQRPAPVPVEELRERLDEARDLYDELDETDDLDDRDPAVLQRLKELEAKVKGLFARMDALTGAMHDFRMSIGTDRQGRSIMVRGLYSIKVAFQIGLIVALVSVLLGAAIGASAAYFGGWVDLVVVWLFSTLSSVPDLVLLAVLVFMFTGSIFDDVTRPYLSLVPVYAAMCLTFWIGPCRVIRGETMKLKELEYVQAATAIGYPRFAILLRHVLPNCLHLMFINFSLLFIAAIKFEVVLSFLGLGVKVGPSWGRMIQESTSQVITGFFWQIGAATVLMFGLVLAFNIVSDALQDAFDPKHVG